MRSVPFRDPLRIGVSGENRSTRYASSWLSGLGVDVVPAGEGEIDILAGGTQDANADPGVLLWDFQVGRPGNGHQASAVSGVSWVIGIPGRPPLALGAEIPEKWCGLLGATLALAALLRHGRGDETTRANIEISAADILRACADQNAGNHGEVAAGWRRNGRLAVEHGGIYPQGFYRCADGHVAAVARSRRDWMALLAALDNPEWSRGQEMQDPFALSRDDSVVDPLLCEELRARTRDELLERALETGATLAPVYHSDELAGRDLMRADFRLGPGTELPFDLVTW